MPPRPAPGIYIYLYINNLLNEINTFCFVEFPSASDVGAWLEYADENSQKSVLYLSDIVNWVAGYLFKKISALVFLALC